MIDSKLHQHQELHKDLETNFENELSIVSTELEEKSVKNERPKQVDYERIYMEMKKKKAGEKVKRGLGGKKDRKIINNKCSLSIEELIQDERYLRKGDLSTKIMNEILNSQESSIGMVVSSSTGKKTAMTEKKVENKAMPIQRSVQESSKGGNSVFDAIMGTSKDKENNKLSDEIADINKRIKEFSKHMRGLEEEVGKLQKSIMNSQEHNDEIR